MKKVHVSSLYNYYNDCKLVYNDLAIKEKINSDEIGIVLDKKIRKTKMQKNPSFEKIKKMGDPNLIKYVEKKQRLSRNDPLCPDNRTFVEKIKPNSNLSDNLKFSLLELDEPLMRLKGITNFYSDINSGNPNILAYYTRLFSDMEEKLHYKLVSLVQTTKARRKNTWRYWVLVSNIVYNQFKRKYPHSKFLSNEKNRYKILDSVFLRSLFMGNLRMLRDYDFCSKLTERKEGSRNFSNSKIYAPLLDTGLFLKMYSFQDQDLTDKLRKNETLALNFFYSKGFNVPNWYVYGESNNIQFLLLEKINGIPLNKFLSHKKEKKEEILLNVVDKLFDLQISGHKRRLPTTYGRLSKKGITEWIKNIFVDIKKSAHNKTCLDKILENYGVASKMLMKCPFTYNKDAYTKNWMVGTKGEVYAIDFENTFIGPVQLDLVTLLAGEGANLSKDKLIPLLKKTYTLLKEKTQKCDLNWNLGSEEDFIDGYFVASLHRNLSMSGTSARRDSPGQGYTFIKKSISALEYLIDKYPGEKSFSQIKSSIEELEL